MQRVPLVLLVLGLLVGCDQERVQGRIRPARDSGVADASRDASLDEDGGASDGGPSDGGFIDTGAPDTGIVDTWPANLATSEDQMLVLVNQQRAQGANCGGTNFGPTQPLTMNMRLRVAARLHSKDMADWNYFEHTNLDGVSFSQRIANQGYSGSTVGENIAAGNSSAMDTFLQWLTSPGHCRNMMNPSFSEIGVGHAFNSSAQYGDYWTQDFGG